MILIFKHIKSFGGENVQLINMSVWKAEETRIFFV